MGLIMMTIEYPIPSMLRTFTTMEDVAAVRKQLAIAAREARAKAETSRCTTQRTTRK